MRPEANANISMLTGNDIANMPMLSRYNIKPVHYLISAFYQANIG